MAFGSVPAVAGVLYGIKPAVTAIVVFAAYRIGSRALKNAWLWSIAAAAFLAIFVTNVPFPFIVLVAGIIGHFGGKYAPSRFVVGGGHKSGDKAFGPALLDDDTPKGFTGIENYQFLATDPSFMPSIAHTLELIVSVLVIMVVGGILMSLLFDRKLYVQGVARLLAIAPFFVMPTVSALIWKNMILHPVYGLVASANCLRLGRTVARHREADLRTLLPPGSEQVKPNDVGCSSQAWKSRHPVCRCYIALANDGPEVVAELSAKLGMDVS